MADRETGSRTRFTGKAAVLVAAMLAVACVAAICALVFHGAGSRSDDDLDRSWFENVFAVDDRERDQPLPIWYEIGGDELALRIDESRIVSATVYNYPVFGSEGKRSLDDLDEAKSFLSLVNGKTFTACQTLDSWNKEREGWSGGYSTSIEFLDGNGDCAGKVNYNPAFPGGGVAVLADGLIYRMEGDQSAVIGLLDKLVQRLSESECSQDGVAAGQASHV